MITSTVFNCSLIQLPKVINETGNITYLTNSKELPFQINRIFYIYDVPNGASRGAHAHKECHQFLVATSGSFQVLLDDGSFQRQILLDCPYLGLHIPPGIWASEANFSAGTICLVLASDLYSEMDYIRDKDEFLMYKFK